MSREQMIDEAVRRVLAMPHIEVARYGGENGEGPIGFIYVRKGPIKDIRAEFSRLSDPYGGITVRDVWDRL